MILKIEDLVSSYGIINSMEFRRDELFVVNNEENAILNLDGDALRQMLRPLLVVVAANDIERSQCGKLIENLLHSLQCSCADGRSCSMVGVYHENSLQPSSLNL